MKKIILQKENGVVYKLDRGKIYIEKNEHVFFVINLHIKCDDKKIVFKNILEEKEDYYLLGSNEPDVTAVLRIEKGHVSFEVNNCSKYIENLEYFLNSYSDSSIMKTFTNDSHANQVDFENTWTSVSSHASPMYEEINNINRTWYLTPQQRAFAMRLHELPNDEEPWFGISMPGPISVFNTKFGLRFKTFKLVFEQVFPRKMNNKLPKVYFVDSLKNEYEILAEHDKLTNDMNLVSLGEYHDWWSKPIVTLSGDIAIEMMRSAELKLNETLDQLLERIKFLEEKIGIKDFTFIMEGYWFENIGNYLEVAKIFGDKYKFREFVDKCHERGHKVVLWFSYFKAGNSLPDYIKESDLIKSSVPTPPDGGTLLFNYNKESVKRYFEETMKFLLSDEEGCLNVDGIKDDFAYLIPVISEEDKSNSNSIGDRLRYETSKFIYDLAKKNKKDAFVTDTSSESYISCDAIRLNDEYGEGVSAWIDRAKKSSYVSDRIIDTDGMFMDSEKYKNYCMISPVIGIPCFYTAHKFFNLEDVVECDYKRLQASWELYEINPVNKDMKVEIDKDNNFYSRRYKTGPNEGKYAAVSIDGKCLVIYKEEKIYVTSVVDKVVEIPIDFKYDDLSVEVVYWDGSGKEYTGIFERNDNGIVIRVEDCAKDIKRFEITIK